MSDRDFDIVIGLSDGPYCNTACVWGWDDGGRIYWHDGHGNASYWTWEDMRKMRSLLVRLDHLRDEQKKRGSIE
jgi:hypothetical protein